ncbi:hypothetical protein WH7805_11973 [Synechococcus sp. WH 7805]|nr:hypothetical protein WH7805_11973 [Synechococcus sp. WH 7805]
MALSEQQRKKAHERGMSLMLRERRGKRKTTPAERKREKQPAEQKNFC